MASQIATWTAGGAVAGAVISEGVLQSHLPQLMAVGATAGLALGWSSLSNAQRADIRQHLQDIRRRLKEISEYSLERLPRTFLTDLMMGVDLRLICGGSAAAAMKPAAAKAALRKAIELIDSAASLFESAGATNLTLFACVVMTYYQFTMCLELKAFADTAGNEELANLLGFDLSQLTRDVDDLLVWWRGVSMNLGITSLDEFLLRSDLLSARLGQAQRILRDRRDDLVVNQRKSEVIQASSLALFAVGGAAARGAGLISKASTTAGFAATGLMLSTWYVQNVGAVLQRLQALNDGLVRLAIKVNSPAGSAARSIVMADGLLAPQPSP